MNETDSAYPSWHRRTPHPVVCYLATSISAILVPEALYIDPGSAHSFTQIVISYSVAFVLSALPLLYYISHRWTIHSVICAGVSLLVLCFALFIIIGTYYHARTSNPSLQATAGRDDASVKIMKTYPLQSALAPASGA